MMNNQINETMIEEILDEAVVRAMERVRTCSLYKVIAVRDDNTVDIEPVVLKYMESRCGEYVMPTMRGGFRKHTSFDSGPLLGINYLIWKHGQWIEEVRPEVGDVGLVVTLYEDYRRWFVDGTRDLTASTNLMKTGKGMSVFIPFVKNNIQTFDDYPTDNGTRILKSNRIKVTMTDPLDTEGNATGNESVKIEMTGITITVDAAGTITVDAPNAATTLNCSTAQVNASDSVTIDTPLTTMTTDVKIGGNLSVGGNVDITGTSKASDHLSSGISGASHTHTSTAPGTPTSGPA